MTNAEPSRGARLMSWLVIGLAVVLLVWGVVQYGWSSEVHDRFWGDIVARADGPMTFRFYLQPTMAAIAAFHDGVRDARTGHMKSDQARSRQARRPADGDSIPGHPGRRRDLAA